MIILTEGESRQVSLNKEWQCHKHCEELRGDLLNWIYIQSNRLREIRGEKFSSYLRLTKNGDKGNRLIQKKKPGQNKTMSQS